MDIITKMQPQNTILNAHYLDVVAAKWPCWAVQESNQFSIEQSQKIVVIVLRAVSYCAWGL